MIGNQEKEVRLTLHQSLVIANQEKADINLSHHRNR